MKLSKRFVLMTASLILVSTPALADPDYGNGEIGATVRATTGTDEGTAGGLAATVSGSVAADGHDYEEPLYAVIGAAQYNAISGGSEGVSTGGGGRVQFFIGHTLKKNNGNGCDVYLGVGGTGEGSINTRKNGPVIAHGAIVAGPETGLFCQVGEVMLMISPTVGIGAANDHHKSASSPTADEAQHVAFGVVAGGRARLVIDDRFFFAAEAVAKIPVGKDDKTLLAQAKLEAMLQVTDKLHVGVYGRGVKITAQDGFQYQGGEAGLTLARAFGAD